MKILLLIFLFSAGLAETKSGVSEEIDTNLMKNEILSDVQRATESEQKKEVKTTNAPTTNGNQAAAPVTANAAEKIIGKSSTFFDWKDYAKMFITLVSLLSLFLGSLFLLKKASKKIRKTATPQMEVISRLSLNQKRELILARVGDETFLIGSSEAGLTFMSSIERINSYEDIPKTFSQSTNAAEAALERLEMKPKNDYKIQLKSRLDKYKPLQ